MPRTLPTERKIPKSYRLTREAVELLERMARERGVSATAILEQAVRAYGKEDTVRRLTDRG